MEEQPHFAQGDASAVIDVALLPCHMTDKRRSSVSTHDDATRGQTDAAAALEAPVTAKNSLLDRLLAPLAADRIVATEKFNRFGGCGSHMHHNM